VKIVPDDLMSWLKCMHIEYLDDRLYSELMQLDLNDPRQLAELIERTFLPEFVACNATSKKSLLAVLEELPSFPEASVRAMLWSAGPLAESLKDYRSFFEVVRTRCAELSSPAAGPSAV